MYLYMLQGGKQIKEHEKKVFQLTNLILQNFTNLRNWSKQPNNLEIFPSTNNKIFMIACVNFVVQVGF